MSQRGLTREDLLDRLESMEDRIDDLERTVELQRRQLDTVRALFAEDGPPEFGAVLEEHDYDHLVDWLEAEGSAVSEQRLQEQMTTVHRERGKLARRVTAVEDELELDDQALATAGGQNTPLDLLERVGPEAIEPNPSETLRRAKVLYENKGRWGQTRTNQRHGRHRFLASKKHDLRTRLEDARGESLQWSQVYRAMKKLAQLGGDHVVFDETDADGKVVVFRAGGGDS